MFISASECLFPSNNLSTLDKHSTKGNLRLSYSWLHQNAFFPQRFINVQHALQEKLHGKMLKEWQAEIKWKVEANHF